MRRANLRCDTRWAPLARTGLDLGEDDRPPALDAGVAGLDAAGDLLDGVRLVFVPSGVGFPCFLTLTSGHGGLAQDGEP
eukprot:3857731-Pyramimonas_sp.AAC.1